MKYVYKVDKGEFMIRFEEDLKNSGYSPHTIRNYMSDIKLAIQQDVIDHNINTFNPDKLKSLDLSATSKHRLASAIKKYAKFLVNCDILDRLPEKLMTMSLPKITNKLVNPMNPNKLRETIDSTGNPQMRLALLILGTTGCRIGSLVDLQVCDITKDGIKFTTAKGNKPYISIVTSEILDLVPKVAKTGYIFTMRGNKKITTNALRNRISRMLGDNYVNPHSYRHTVATELINSGTDIYTVATLLNHSNINTTLRYTHVTAKQLQDKMVGHPLEINS